MADEFAAKRKTKVSYNDEGYADFDKPSAINIYPKDFETKQEVINILDSYNENIKKIDEEIDFFYIEEIGRL